MTLTLRHKIALCFLALALPAYLWWAAGADGALNAPRYEPIDCPFYHDNALCGIAHLPEARGDDGNSNTVQVFIAQLGAGNDSAPAVILGGGGPGGDLFLSEAGGIDFWDDYRKAALGKSGKLILMEQRGTGLSRPALRCPEEKPLIAEMMEQALSSQEELEIFIPMLQGCLHRLQAEGIQVTAYTTAAAADDVEDIRHLLEIDEWHLIGFSYGTRLALEVMRRHPQGVKSALLDSAFPYDYWRRQPFYPFAAVLERIAADCKQQAHCLRHGDLHNNLARAMQLAEEAPLTLPIQYNGTRYRIQLTAPRVPGLLHLGVYDETGVAALPFFLRQLAQGDTENENARYFARLMLDFLFDENWATMLNYAISCQESPAPSDEHPPATPLEHYEHSASQDYREVCDALWGAPADTAAAAAAPPPQPVSSDKPVLLINGRYDPTTPPQWASHLAQRLPNAQHIVNPSASHTPSIVLPCLQEAVRAFFRAPWDKINDYCDDESLSFY